MLKSLVVGHMKSISNSFFKGIKNDKRETGIENKKAVENRK